MTPSCGQLGASVGSHFLCVVKDGSGKAKRESPRRFVILKRDAGFDLSPSQQLAL
jgi:hypothetical protein